MPAWRLNLVDKFSEQINRLTVTWAGWFFYYFLPYRRRIVKSNINQAFASSLGGQEQKLLAQAFYSHLLKSIKEIVGLRFLSIDQLKNKVEVRGLEHLNAVAAQGQGTLILTGHFGNWELAPIGGILNFSDFQGRFHFIRRLIGNKWLERVLFRRYYEAGLNVIPKKNSLSLACEALEKNHAVVFVLDQHASLANRDGVAVEFFGKKAGTYRSLALIARNTSIPVVPAAGYRLPNGQHVLEFYKPLEWQQTNNSQHDIYQNTLAYNQALEKMIIQHPEQWMWLHKRWKL